MCLQSSRDKKKLFGLLVISFITVSGGVPFTFLSFAGPANSLPSASQSQVHKTESDFFTAVEDVSRNVGPAVVSIRTERTEHYRPKYSLGGPFDDELFNRFFEDFFGDQFDREYKRAGLGSGVIIDQRGYILTNEHVVGGADKILVRLADGREAKGTLTGTDPRGDLAVIKIDLSGLPTASLGDSDQLKIGQWVVAIGNPFGYILSNPEPTVTTGVVSALRRSLPRTSQRDTDYTDLIQTDAAINPGNSGGPLVSLDGEIVGINVAIFSTSGGYQGIGFAIPISHAKRVIAQLIKGEKVTYGWIGVSVQDINKQLADYFGLETQDGVVVTGVLEGGPADTGGIKNGDIVLSVDDKKIRNTAALINIIGISSVGKKASLKVLRNGKTLNFPVVIKERPAFDEEGRVVQKEEPITEEPEEGQGPVVNNWRGLRVTDIPPRMISRLDYPTKAGVLIAEIENNSPAEETGLRKGDVIVSINQQVINDTGDFYRVVRKARGDCLIQTIRGYFVIKEK